MFVDFLVADKGVIHKPAPEPRGGWEQYLEIFVEVGYNGVDRGTHGCSLNLFIELVLERKVGVLETKLQ